MRRLDTRNKFIWGGCILLCYLMLVFFYIVMVRKGIPLLILGGMAVLGAVKKKWPVVAVSICLLLLGWVCTFQWTKTRAALEQVHFTLLKPYYQSQAEKILEKISQAEDTHVWKEFDGGSDWFLSKRTYNLKAGGHVVIFFTTKYSDVSGYIYLPDDEALSVIAEPSRYWSDVGEEPLFSHIHELGGQWMFVRTY